MITIILATTNTHKVEEIKAWLASQALPVAIHLEAMPMALDVDETGLTFTANALLKAQAAQTALQALSPYQSMANEAKPVWILAEDSGFVVEALAGTDGLPEFPGVHSNRWLTPARRAQLLGQPLNKAPITDTDRCHALWALLDFLTVTAHTAQYCCAMVLLPLHSTTTNAMGYRSHGTMALALNTQDRLLKGTHGFGYDPMVYPVVNGCALPSTVAQLPASQKNALSHRGKALSDIVQQLL
jgi:XTP/dITP diphosphohydrolase